MNKTYGWMVEDVCRWKTAAFLFKKKKKLSQKEEIFLITGGINQSNLMAAHHFNLI